MVRTGRASFAQERLYFLDQLQPGNPAYVVAFAVHLRGALRPEALRTALTRVVARHDALRTTFAVVDGVLTQRVSSTPAVDVDITADGWVDRATQETHLRTLVAEQARQPFDLANGPVVRAYLRSWGPDEHGLAVLVHHIACDGWSVGLLLRDLAAEYDAGVDGSVAAYEEPAESYLAYAERQHETWRRDSSGLDFWRAALVDVPQLALPTDFPRPSVLGTTGAVLRRPVEPELVRRLGEWGRARGVTLFAVTLAAYASVLSRYVRQDEVVVGVPVANRMDDAEERLVGCLVNTLPIRLDVSGRPSFTELVDRAQRTSMAAFANQDVPFEQIVRATVGERQLSHAPLFQTSLTVQNFPFAFPEFAGVRLTEVDVEIDVTKFDLGLTLDVSTDVPFLRAEYSTELFRAETVGTLLTHYLTFLRSIVDEEQREPSMVDEAERAQLTEGVNPPLASAPVTHPSVLRRFADHVAATPDAVAVRHRDVEITYAELDRWAGRIAAGLADRGVRPGVRVGLLLGRSPAVVAAILGVWKLGGVYVPLDPDYPRQRLELIAANAGMAVLVVDPETAEAAAALTRDSGTPLADAHTLDGISVIEETFPGPDDPAYVIYTSGSTGVPKGVLVGHGGLDALNSPTPAGLDVTAADVWLAASSFSFDASVWEMWGALTTGARLVIAERVDLVDRERLARLVRREAVTVLFQTPGALYRLLPPYLRALEEDETSRIRYVVLGGEALSWSRLASLIADAPGLQTVFVNMYGITEGTIHVTIFQASAADVPRVPEGAIGVPLPSARCYVLDEDLRPTGLNVPGELYCGGALVAHGYLDNPELTEARFPPDPYGGGVMYRTGDVVKWGLDGSMVYLGRNDTQVQVRGYRVELAEVEGALLTHAAVRSCAVAAEDDELVAFVVHGIGPDAEHDLRAHLRETLPAYMVPSRILTVATIPLTAHGKVDLPRLLADSRAARTVTAPSRPPASVVGTGLEERIRACWVEVLRRPDVGLHDNFFDLGGHSFALIALQQRMSEEGLDVSVTDLFRCGTIAGCAAALQHTAPVVADPNTAQRRQGRALLADRRRSVRAGRG
ncbi:amino acid adenylation domain-containing protein [Micromonospora sp. M51]|uniref:non-ribosomal peptide synthetase n=1 Tax=Micromonospora sp. M51 TaxID=2824889 RepID=UPI001B367317|nr:non-ribosomal peptide synthetase [Micromonospora sp. M51]MBQ1011274.1 amino acid adenylation domain-containing protein [Micromonospora sp. M51]